MANFCKKFWHTFAKNFGALLQNILAHFCIHFWCTFTKQFFFLEIFSNIFGELLQTFLVHICSTLALFCKHFWRTFANIFGALLQIFWSTFAENFWHTFANFLVYFWPTLLKATQIDSLISRLVMASKTFTNVSLICIHLQQITF